jgi:hypothetical protein
MKFKIIMINLKEIKCLQIMIYNKPGNILKKVFVQFQEILNYAKINGYTLSDDKDVNKILTK